MGKRYKDAVHKEGDIEIAFEELRAQRVALANSRRKKLASSLSLTVGDIEYALRKCRGNLLHAARFLGVERALLKRKVSSFPTLQRLMEELEQENLDEAEHQLMEAVTSGYFPAVSMMLRTKGKDRGYTEKFEGDFEVGAGTAAALIDAMRKGAEPKALPDPNTIEVGEYTVMETTDAQSATT